MVLDTSEENSSIAKWKKMSAVDFTRSCSRTFLYTLAVFHVILVESWIVFGRVDNVQLTGSYGSWKT